ncbi:pre-peptidase C-terminal domain-containing protein [Okeania sp.]|uniref:pre-peptidase C-terminal domain-containing protein n=1 Tax=Okeania sp. TaxID=3100323 RepID=UPI002B4ACE5C|nr:pre-peptidase C-terminal domain-containing protein [Okeania sp.]MEB3340599.1 pre-peptidase C-terminal domain-containing protein [Okeania sp.]
MRQLKFWAIAPFGLLTILGRPSFPPSVLPEQVIVSSNYVNEISTKSKILAQGTSLPEESPSLESTPTPEESSSPEIISTPEATPLPETTPASEESPSAENTPPTQEQNIILQQEGTLSDGDLVLDSDESVYDEHNFEGTEDQVVIVTLESSDFDTYLAVFSPSGELLGEHDDISEKNTNSELTITLPVTGKYRVIVNSFDKTGRGKYNLQVIESGGTSN